MCLPGLTECLQERVDCGSLGLLLVRRAVLLHLLVDLLRFRHEAKLEGRRGEGRRAAGKGGGDTYCLARAASQVLRHSGQPGMKARMHCETGFLPHGSRVLAVASH